MLASTHYWLKRAALIVSVSAVTLLVWRVYDTEQGPPLALWHTVVTHELSERQIDKADWAQWLAAEQHVFDEVRREVSDQLPAMKSIVTVSSAPTSAANSPEIQ